jgi:dihydrofolate reductase
MYGRVAYEGMVQYWTSPAAAGEEAQKLAAAKKLVFSRTLQRADWGQVTIIRDNIAEEINRRKAEPGGDMVLIAGASIANTFLGLDLIDELNLIIQPVLLGGGKRLFDAKVDRRNLQLIENTTLPGGLIHALYRR